MSASPYSLPPDEDDDPESWRIHANCRGFDTDIWYPELGANSRYAQRVCQRCPVKMQCLQYALDNEEVHGVWGGTTSSERIEIFKRRGPK
ncbi:WhiB family transcriptional regulator [Mycolicibacter kumamotonensis]|uniref:Transcriptional regulator WhiB n=1 Tax=Mycolicibacter kumamotonensis TaxID=354243 RepID=A0A1B8SL61_9MYCO|nr:WhiB family transcriptional regulator [Mycolicibacter kumamotonensis]OBY33430.1 hypothetical protein ACT18_00260 [Mycolicibacter kumamotonensis]